MSKKTWTLVCLEHLGSDHHALTVILTTLVSVSLFEECVPLISSARAILLFTDQGRKEMDR